MSATNFPTSYPAVIGKCFDQTLALIKSIDPSDVPVQDRAVFARFQEQAQRWQQAGCPDDSSLRALELELDQVATTCRALVRAGVIRQEQLDEAYISPSDRDGCRRLCKAALTIPGAGSSEVEATQSRVAHDKPGPLSTVQAEPSSPRGSQSTAGAVAPQQPEPGLDLMTLRVHPAALALPSMENEPLEELAKDIAEHGLRTPLVVAAVGGEWMLIDGVSRREACRRGGITPTYTVYEKTDITSFVIGVNVHRRHLTSAQRAALLPAITPMLAEEARDRMMKGVAPVGARGEKTSVTVGKVLGLSPRTVERASAVHARGVPELQNAMHQGEISISAASEIAARPHEEQRLALSDAVKLPRGKRTKKPKRDAPTVKAAKTMLAQQRHGEGETVGQGELAPEAPRSGDAHWEFAIDLSEVDGGQGGEAIVDDELWEFLVVAGRLHGGRRPFP